MLQFDSTAMSDSGPGNVRDLVVLKFGGTSVASRKNWETIRGILNARLEDGVCPIVVCSALAGVTNQLEKIPQAIQLGRSATDVVQAVHAIHHDLANQLGLRNREGYQRTLDRLTALVDDNPVGTKLDSSVCAEIIAHGELLSSRMGCDWLREQGLAAEWRDARDWLTSEEVESSCSAQRYLSAVCSYDNDPQARSDIQRRGQTVFVTQGFIARNSKQETVLLGRGGSDTAATYIAAKLCAARVEIWTDVPGVFTANPHQVEDARLLRHLTYEEAETFAGHGAKVLHPRCVEPLRENGIPMAVHWTHEPTFSGTRVDAQQSVAGVKGVSMREGLLLVTMERERSWQSVGFMADIASCFKNCGLSINLVSSSANRIQAIIDPSISPGTEERVADLVEQLNRFSNASVRTGVSSVSLVGHDIRKRMHALAPFMEILHSLDLLMVAQAANDLSFTFVVPDEQAQDLGKKFHETLFAKSELTPTFGPSWLELGRKLEHDRSRGFAESPSAG